MNSEEPFAAWLEDEDSFREEVMRKVSRELAGVPIHFSGTVGGFWECLSKFQPNILLIDVVLPQIPGVTRLSEGVALARWVREGKIPAEQAQSLDIAEGVRTIAPRYRGAPILFVTGRSGDRLKTELTEAGVQEYQILEKGGAEEESAVDAAVRIIKEAWESAKPK